MGHRATVNQVVQVGPEATPGTPVACGKLITAFTWTFGPKVTTKQFTGTGRKHPNASELLTEMGGGKISGQGDFAQLPYVATSVWGKVTPALHSPSVTAYDWKLVDVLSGAGNPQTFTAQNGDSNDAEQYAYLMFSGWGYTFGRKQEVQVSGDWFSQSFTDNITLTASPTEVPVLPMTGAMANIYLDNAAANIGNTQLNNPMSVSFAASNYYGQFWPINRANASYTAHLDLLPKNELKIKLEADSTAIAFKPTYLAVGARAYVRVSIQGPLIDVANSVHAAMTHDMAVFVTDVSELGDTDGIYAVEYTCVVAEDTAWTLGAATGTAQICTFTNLQSAL